jgi:hypothetical protein
MSQIIRQCLSLLVAWLSVVQFPNGDLLLLNEEGKLMGLPLNPEATALWRAHFTKEKFPIRSWDDFVVGPAMVITKQALNTWAN